MREYQAIERAIQIVQAGFAGRQRIGPRSVPAATHSLRVGLDLIAYGYPIEVCLAGFCHDLVEDTDVTLETLEQLFNKRVSDLVHTCSFDPALGERAGDDDLNNRVLRLAEEGDTHPLIIKCADAADNLKTSRGLKTEWQLAGMRSARIRLDGAKQFFPNDSLTDDFTRIFEREKQRIANALHPA